MERGGQREIFARLLFTSREMGIFPKFPEKISRVEIWCNPMCSVVWLIPHRLLRGLYGLVLRNLNHGISEGWYEPLRKFSHRSFPRFERQSIWSFHCSISGCYVFSVWFRLRWRLHPSIRHSIQRGRGLTPQKYMEDQLFVTIFE